MTAQKTALVTVVGDKAPPSLAEAAAQLGVMESDLNEAFGVVAIDPEQSLYAVEVRADRLPTEGSEVGSYRGPFSNPRIEALGPWRETSEEEN